MRSTKLKIFIVFAMLFALCPPELTAAQADSPPFFSLRQRPFSDRGRATPLQPSSSHSFNPGEEVRERNGNFRTAYLAIATTYDFNDPYSAGIGSKYLQEILMRLSLNLNLLKRKLELTDFLASEDITAVIKLYQTLRNLLTSAWDGRVDNKSEAASGLIKYARDCKELFERLSSIQEAPLGASIKRVPKRYPDDPVKAELHLAVASVARDVKYMRAFWSDRLTLCEGKNVEGAACSFSHEDVKRRLKNLHKKALTIRGDDDSQNADVAMQYTRLFTLINTLIAEARIRCGPDGSPVTVSVKRENGLKGELVIAVNYKGANIPDEKSFLPAPGEPGIVQLFALEALKNRVLTNLAMVWDIVGIAGGRIQVQSIPGEGTTFTVRLPLAQLAPAARPAPSNAGARPAAAQI